MRHISRTPTALTLATHAAEPGIRPKVLVVDDDAAKRLAICAMLDRLGHAVVDVDSGHGALLAVSAQQFAVILMEARMPTMSGYEAAKRIRLRSESAATPIIFMTAFGRDEVETTAAYASGAVDFIFSPIAGDALRAKVTAFVDLFARAHEHQQALDSIAVLRHEAQLDRIVFEEAPIGSVITGRDGRIERVNLALCTMLGHIPEAFSGAHFLDFTHPEDREHSAAAVDSVMSGALGAPHFDARYLHASGRVVETRIALTAIRDDADEVAQLFAQVEDVTDARRTTRELQQAQFEMLARLAAAAELHEDDTGQHTLRVADLSVAIGRTIGLPDEQLELLRLAAPLHDVGKIAISDAVLRKRGKLTIEEFDQVKTHTTSGAQMLAGSPYELLALAEQIALTHHEHWDGSGYPTGLAGEAIPITGRIVAVADVFDALTHPRPYKAAWSTADAITELTSHAGTHFDPLVVDAFLSGHRAH